MTRFLAIGLVLALEATAAAQSVDSTATFQADSAVSPVSIVEGPGWKVGEGTVLHPVFGVETGYVSNTFYADEDIKPAGILRLIAQIGTSSLSPQRLAGTDSAETEEPQGQPANAGSFQYRLDVRASYDLMLSGNDAVSDTGGLGLGASAYGLVNPNGPISFQVSDNFNRLIRAANFETDANTNRDINTLRLALIYKSQNHTFGGGLYYENYLDIFERDEQSFADRMQHRFGIRPHWQWRPKTQFYIDASMGYMSGIGSDADMKVSSYPLTIKGGIATLLSPMVSVNLEGGYQNGFYDGGPSYSSPLVNAQVAYRYSPFGRVALGYSYQHNDSVNANFYREHVIQGWLRHVVRPITFMIQPELHFRQYEGITLVMGPPTREDLIFAVISGASYNFRDWMAATINYRFSMVETDYRYGAGALTDDPSYVRHEILAGMRFAL